MERDGSAEHYSSPPNVRSITSYYNSINQNTVSICPTTPATTVNIAIYISPRIHVEHPFQHMRPRCLECINESHCKRIMGGLLAGAVIPHVSVECCRMGFGQVDTPECLYGDGSHQKNFTDKSPARDTAISRQVKEHMRCLLVVLPRGPR